MAQNSLNQPAFTRSLRGYSVEEVDAYVDYASGRYSSLRQENTELKKKITALRTELENYKKSDDGETRTKENSALEEKLIIDNANKTAENIIKEAVDTASGIKNSNASFIKEQFRLSKEANSTIENLKKSLDNEFKKTIDALNELIKSSKTRLAEIEEKNESMDADAEADDGKTATLFFSTEEKQGSRDISQTENKTNFSETKAVSEINLTGKDVRLIEAIEETDDTIDVELNGESIKETEFILSDVHESEKICAEDGKGAHENIIDNKKDKIDDLCKDPFVSHDIDDLTWIDAEYIADSLKINSSKNSSPEKKEILGDEKKIEVVDTNDSKNDLEANVEIIKESEEKDSETQKTPAEIAAELDFYSDEKHRDGESFDPVDFMSQNVKSKTSFNIPYEKM